MTQKEISSIEEKLRSGLSRGDIFRALGATDNLATQIAAVPNFGDRERYSRFNSALFVILFYTGIAQAAFPIINFLTAALPIYLAFSLFFPVILSAFLIYSAFETRKFNGRFYGSSGLLCFYVFFSSLSAYSKSNELGEFFLWLVINFPILFGGFLSFYLKKKLCPYLGLWGAKTNGSGHYLFLDATE
jgi:hypothetical protein